MWAWVLVGVLLLGALSSAQSAPRMRSVIRAFLVESGYPDGRAGYVVDHEIPICAGGPQVDVISNLQWQERQASYRKDVFERELCKDMVRQGLIMMKVTPK